MIKKASLTIMIGFIALLAGISLLGCTTSASNSTQPLAWITQASVETDVAQAIAQEDFRLWIFTGRGVSLLGIPAEQMTLAKQQCGLRYLPGTGDVIHNQEQLKLRQRAQTYTQQYNSLIYKACLSHHQS